MHGDVAQPLGEVLAHAHQRAAGSNAGDESARKQVDAAKLRQQFGRGGLPVRLDVVMIVELLRAERVVVVGGVTVRELDAAAEATLGG